MKNPPLKAKPVHESNIRQPIIQVENLIKTFGHLTALRGISFTLNRGDFFVLFGPNGAGKTTLIRILSALLHPTSGRVLIDNCDMSECAEELRQKIGVISHHVYLYNNLTAHENIVFFARLYNVANPEKRADQVIGEVGLIARKNDLVRTFSRGMYQRLSIARAIVHDPQIVLLDEPYTGLDQHAAQMLKNLLVKLHQAQRTIVMITHNLQRGVEIGTRLAIQVKGQIVFNEYQHQVDLAGFEELYFKYVGN
ncbi:MAG: heme ABC exporter ATP-binding protein CcmA [Candidatus Schekmanbacteria bacterium]|nr:heme ABC exporter ATP-binding protein CcmA [Candidatus Schekmanbacteria bacterium]